MRLQPAGHSTAEAKTVSRMTRAADTLMQSLGCDALRARFDREFDLFTSLPDMRKGSAAVLAARASGGYLTTLPGALRQPLAASALGGLCQRLAGPYPGDADLMLDWRLLCDVTRPVDPVTLADEDLAQIASLWDLAVATEQLLVLGGDDRLTLDADSGLNRYGCTPYPRPDIIAFGSCTASTISTAAFAAAGLQRLNLLLAALAAPSDVALAEAARSVSRSLLRYFGVEGAAEAMLVASGTDAALLVTALISAAHPGRPLTSILMSPSETGSGVPQAVQGRHFAPCAASGDEVTKGASLEGIGSPTLETIMLRDDQGRPRPQPDIEAECGAPIAAASAAGRHAVLHAIDGSKTGLAGPDRAALRRLATRFGTDLTIVLDACQVRIEPAQISGAIREGYFILVTGSKFFSAPGFCGAVLAPQQRLQRTTPLPAGLAAYATGLDGMIGRRCPGLLLRWTAALHSMHAFAALPAETVREAIESFASEVKTLVGRNPRLRLIDAPRPSGAGWSECGSVITFAVATEDAAAWLSAEALRPLYLALAADCSATLGPLSPTDRAIASTRCAIGQPVSLGAGLGGLRIALSADQIVRHADVSRDVRLVFAKLDLLLRPTA